MERGQVLSSSPKKKVLPYAFTLTENCFNNMAEYQALTMGLEMTIELKVTRLKVFRDSKLIITNSLQFTKLKSLSFDHMLIMRKSSCNGLTTLALSICLEKKNRQADSLANLASALTSSDDGIKVPLCKR